MSFTVEVLLWCIVQVTLIGLLAGGLCIAMRRWASAAHAVVPAAALAAIVGLTLCAFVPWPSWWRFGPARQPAVAAGTNRESHDSGRSFVPAETAESLFDGAPAPASELASPPSAVATDVQSAEVGDAAPTDTPSTAGLSLLQRATAWLPAILATILGGGILLGLGQVLGGLLSVRAHRRSSRKLTDPALLEQVDVLRAELSLQRPIELRESQSLATAATIGWLAPVILLPADWRGWTDDQRRAVLAHELAHVARGDFLACVLAQLSLALHFYHPLVHWLAARLRLEQELAADATAAELSGGKRRYLTSLAELALHTSERSLGWPAHTFLPTQGTFLRRIEMLRDSKPALSAVAVRPRRTAHWAAVGLLVVAAILIAGLRGGSDPSPFDSSAAAQAPAAGAAENAGAIDLGQVTNDAKFLVAVRPSQLLAQQDVRKAFFEAAPEGPPLMQLLAIENLEQLTFVGPAGVDPDRWNSAGIIILQFSQPTSIDAVKKAAPLPGGERKPADGAPLGAGESGYGTPNDRTIILGEEPELTKYLANRRKGQPAIAAGEGWEKVAKGALIAALDMEVVRDQVREAGHAPPPELGAVAPLWTDCEYLLAGIIVEGKTVHLRQVATCQDARLAENVADTTKAAVTLARNMMRTSRERNKELPAFVTMVFDTAEGLLKTVKVEQSGSLVIAQTSTEIPAAKSAAAGSLLGAIAQARGSAQRATSANNLKQIMLAMHMWADVHGGMFPPPVIYGQDGKGKVPHSWRVELLPYLEQDALYRAYQFDEPWDSEANKKVLAQMPAVFRHPADDAKSTSSGYYVLTPAKLFQEKVLPGGGVEAPPGGLPTAFSKATGVRFSDVTDGTSYTLAAFEAKRDIPWTKPEDILFDPEKDLPQLGGFFKDGFNAGYADGSVHFISGKIEPKTLKLLITPQDGTPLPALP